MTDAQFARMCSTLIVLAIEGTKEDFAQVTLFIEEMVRMRVKHD